QARTQSEIARIAAQSQRRERAAALAREHEPAAAETAERAAASMLAAVSARQQGSREAYLERVDLLAREQLLPGVGGFQMKACRPARVEREPRPPESHRIEAEHEHHTLRREHAREFGHALFGTGETLERMLRDEELEGFARERQPIGLARYGAIEPRPRAGEIEHRRHEMRRQMRRSARVRAHEQPEAAVHASEDRCERGELAREQRLDGRTGVETARGIRHSRFG